MRVAPAVALHDRLILVDDTDGYMAGQSFNCMAQRAHTAIIKMDADLAAQKVGAYAAIWAASAAL